MAARPSPTSVDRAATGDWKRIFALLDTALDLTPAALAPWMATLAADDPATAATLGGLMDRRAEATAADFLHPPLARADHHVAFPAFAPVEPAPGTTVGPYRLLDEIGRGGTATVWLAERTDGFIERKVALKLPEIGGPRPAGFAERLRRERHILASLEHPGIARLYDAGIDGNGRPYLALEYVDGQPIDVFARTRSLPVRERVRLLIDVARTVGHAHARLVVHRDLKPSNILVDTKGAVHLLDFGIAKLIEPSPDDAGLSPATIVGVRALTPDYASPEQIRGEALGTASDLYSLGIVAFELLTDARPYRFHGIHAADAMIAARAGVDVPLASSTVDDPRRRRELRGDLDAIVAHLLAPHPIARYATMEALADDLERHLARQPVVARAASRSYLLRRWFARHRLETGIGAALMIALAGGAYAQVVIAFAIATGALLALWQRDQALKQAAVARAALERSDTVKSFIASIFTQAVPRTGRGGPVAAIDLLKHAAQRVETDLASEPDVAAELGALIGASFNELGDVKAGALWLPKTVERCTRAFGPTHPLTLQSRRRWVEAANTVGDLATAEAQLPSLIEDLRTVRPAQTKLLVESLQSRAFVATKREREADAMAALNEALAVASEHYGIASTVWLSARVSHSNTLAHFGRYAAALKSIEPAIAPAYALFAEQRPHPLLNAVERCQGDALAQCGRPREAVGVLRGVLRDQRLLDVDETTRVRVIMTMLAKALYFGGHFVEAAGLFAEAAHMHVRLTGDRNDEAMGAWTWLAQVDAMLGRVDAARDSLERADRAAMPVPSSVPHVLRALAEAIVEMTNGDHSRALAHVDGSGADRLAQSDSLQLRAARIRAWSRREAGQPDEAIANAAAIATATTASSAGLERGLLFVELARCHNARGGPADGHAAAQSLAAAFEAWEAGEVDGHDLLESTRAEFGLVPGRIARFEPTSD